jgi:thymidylate kinase
MKKFNNVEPALYVTIHGPDGVGKTTTGRGVTTTLIENGFKAVFFDDWRADEGWVNPFASEILKNTIDGRSEGFIALQAAKVAMDSIIISDLTNSGTTVVKDRGLLDVRADLQHRGLDSKKCAGPLIREPDLSFLLTVNESTRLGRLSGKVDVQPIDYQPNTPGNRLFNMTTSLNEQVEQMTDRGLIIATDQMSLEGVVSMISSTILEQLWV